MSIARILVLVDIFIYKDAILSEDFINTKELKFQKEGNMRIFAEIIFIYVFLSHIDQNVAEVRLRLG